MRLNIDAWPTREMVQARRMYQDKRGHWPSISVPDYSVCRSIATLLVPELVSDSAGWMQHPWLLPDEDEWLDQILAEWHGLRRRHDGLSTRPQIQIGFEDACFGRHRLHYDFVPLTAEGKRLCFNGNNLWLLYNHKEPHWTYVRRDMIPYLAWGAICLVAAQNRIFVRLAREADLHVYSYATVVWAENGDLEYAKIEDGQKRPWQSGTTRLGPQEDQSR